MGLPQSFEIAKAEDGYIVKPTVTDSSNALFISSTGQADIVDAEKLSLLNSFKRISGIVGVIHLHIYHYLITIDSASEVGTIYGDKKVYKVADFSILRLSSKKFPVDEDETKYVELLRAHLKNATLFFSYDYDLTKSFGKQTTPGVDSEFMWNYFASQSLIELAAKNPYAGNFVLPLIYGYAKFVRTSINLKPITFGLITRRSRFRAGTRYFRRGIDKDGHVANYNETEQLLVVHTPEGDKVSSYLQTRGSVPVYWAEMNNLKYKPSLLIGPTDYSATKKHFEKTVQKYGVNYLVNLVNQSGYEKPVKLSYESAVTALNDPNIKYTYFDFHHECRKMRWDRVKLLLEHLSGLGLSRNDYSSFFVGEKFVPEKVQKHAVRTNCMDCLDRTNVVQSTLAHWYLQQQLEDDKIISEGQDWSAIDPKFLFVFQNIWADNADAVSTSYSGTGALKTDYTRTGKRTKLGALNDLSNSISRYIKNNYRDGSRQDGYDLFLGNILPYEIATSPFPDVRPALTQAIPYGFLASLMIFLTTLIYPKGSLTEFKNLSFLAVFFSISLVSFRYIVKDGVQYVNWPKLSPLDYLTKREVLNDGNVEGARFEKKAYYNKFTEDTKKE
ncbi:unnamed protein product [Ambrosiozyma monospora]|uniref:Unnamed protein product n=1 Tax=Ambrosiozyma monospora TaxID=43982 RepID=A0A9W6YXE0_AMBMO|nr:unnamed protein product [Ambrosiozyma monospora]